MSKSRFFFSSRLPVAGLVASACLASGSAVAAPVTYNFVAEITIINELNGGAVTGLSLSDIVTGSFTYDAGIALTPTLSITRQELIDGGLVPLPVGDPLPTDGTGAFHADMADDISESFEAFGGPDFGGGPPVFSIDFDFGNGATASFEESGFVRHRTNEFTPTPDRPNFAYDTMIAFAGFPGFASGIRLMDDAVYSGLFPSDATLLELPTLDELFLARVFTSNDFDGDGVADTQIFAEVRSLTRDVPAPAGLGLLGLGLIALGMRKR